MTLSWILGAAPSSWSKELPAGRGHPTLGCPSGGGQPHPRNSVFKDTAGICHWGALGGKFKKKKKSGEFGRENLGFMRHPARDTQIFSSEVKIIHSFSVKKKKSSTKKILWLPSSYSGHSKMRLKINKSDIP